MPQSPQLVSFAALFAVASLAPAMLAQAPDAPPPLTWQQLFARPDLWPGLCHLTKDKKVGERGLAAGSEFPVVELRAASVIVEMAELQHLEVNPGDCDVLAVANAAFAKMTPAQRELDIAALAKRADLWPAKVATTCALDRVGFNADQALGRGAELDFGSFDGTWVRARHKTIDGLRALRLGETDFVERARAALAVPAASPKPNRVLSELDGKLVQATTGARKKLNAKEPPQYLLLYFSAGWCGPCQRFSPELVRFHEQQKQQFGKRFQTVWISRDKKESEMRRYAKAHDFPWLAVAWNKLDEVPMTQAYGPLGIPDLVLLDGNGAVLATSYDGNDYKGPERVLTDLAERLGRDK